MRRAFKHDTPLVFSEQGGCGPGWLSAQATLPATLLLFGLPPPMFPVPILHPSGLSLLLALGVPGVVQHWCCLAKVIPASAPLQQWVS